MNKSLKISIGLALIFLIGLASGGMLGVALYKQQLNKPANIKLIGAVVKKEMIQKLDLDASQQRQFDPLVDRATDRIQVIYDETLQRIDGVLREEQGELVSFLRPDQVKKLSSLAKSREDFIRQHNPMTSPK